ncbi:hypothetical protein F0562_005235 [Nyssa sinensis]|uniref:Uncharacterized protein n=1 Tax=Nyssa sinensis TaxID=561372 RepID=A0A5J5ALJ7_9ASTE|nr:hypothetical protein F0562_005235 [Nyssa sinensis]
MCRPGSNLGGHEDGLLLAGTGAAAVAVTETEPIRLLLRRWNKWGPDVGRTVMVNSVNDGEDDDLLNVGEGLPCDFFLQGQNMPGLARGAVIAHLILLVAP